MTIVYVVTDGACSDYHVYAVYDNKEMAERHASLAAYDGEVLEMELNGPADFVRQGMSMYQMIMTKAGDVRGILNEGADYSSASLCFWHRWGDELLDVLYIRVMARNEQHAVKIVNEKRTQILAMNLWGNLEAVKAAGIV